MTDLNKKVKRVTHKHIHEAGRTRPIVVILQPPGLLGFRAKGCRKIYYLPVENCYHLAVKAEVALQKKLKKQKKRSIKK